MTLRRRRLDGNLMERITATRNSCPPWIVAALLGVHAALLAWSGWRHSPVVVEPAHLAAGVAHLQRGGFDLYRVNPPLVRMAAAVPVVLTGLETDWVRDDPNPLRRCEFDVGQDLLRANGHRSLWLITLARWGCIPFALIGGVVVYRWATELFGAASGLMALALFCFSPSMLGHGALLTPDAHAASLAVAAAYLFYRWVQAPTWRRALTAGCVLGLAELTKSTLLLLYPAFALVWFIGRRPHRGAGARHVDWPMLAAVFCVSLMVLNLGYGLESSGRRLDSFSLQSRLFAATAESAGSSMPNRFAQLGLGWLRVPLPANYVQGIDAQRLDFEQTRMSYLCGEWRLGGWPQFYVVASLIKAPLGALALLAAALAVFLAKPEYRATSTAEWSLLAPAVLVFVVVSSQTGFSIHPRYVLPAYPFLMIWISRVARAFPLNDRRLAGFATVAISASVASSLWCYPHALSYFNEAVGGPRRGHRWLIDSGLAWGQDLAFLEEWLEHRSDTSRCYLASFGYLDPAHLGIDHEHPDEAVAAWAAEPASSTDPSDRPLWCIFDVNHLMGSPEWAAAAGGARRPLRISRECLATLREREPYARIGYSLLVYRIAERGRDSGLNPLRGGARGQHIEDEKRRDGRWVRAASGGDIMGGDD